MSNYCQKAVNKSYCEAMPPEFLEKGAEDKKIEAEMALDQYNDINRTKSEFGCQQNSKCVDLIRNQIRAFVNNGVLLWPSELSKAYPITVPLSDQKRVALLQARHIGFKNNELLIKISGALKVAAQNSKPLDELSLILSQKEKAAVKAALTDEKNSPAVIKEYSQWAYHFAVIADHIISIARNDISKIESMSSDEASKKKIIEQILTDALSALVELGKTNNISKAISNFKNSYADELKKLEHVGLQKVKASNELKSGVATATKLKAMKDLFKEDICTRTVGGQKILIINCPDGFNRAFNGWKENIPQDSIVNIHQWMEDYFQRLKNAALIANQRATSDSENQYIKIIEAYHDVYKSIENNDSPINKFIEKFNPYNSPEYKSEKDQNASLIVLRALESLRDDFHALAKSNFVRDEKIEKNPSKAHQYFKKMVYESAFTIMQDYLNSLPPASLGLKHSLIVKTRQEMLRYLEVAIKKYDPEYQMTRGDHFLFNSLGKKFGEL